MGNFLGVHLSAPDDAAACCIPTPPATCLIFHAEGAGQLPYWWKARDCPPLCLCPVASAEAVDAGDLPARDQWRTTCLPGKVPWAPALFPSPAAEAGNWRTHHRQPRTLPLVAPPGGHYSRTAGRGTMQRTGRDVGEGVSPMGGVQSKLRRSPEGNFSLQFLEDRSLPTAIARARDHRSQPPASSFPSRLPSAPAQVAASAIGRCKSLWCSHRGCRPSRTS